MNSSIIKLWMFFLVFFPLTLSLGFWQLDRASYKAEMAAASEASAAMEPLEYSEGKALSPSDYSRWILRGEYSDRSFLLDNRTRAGVPGYEVLTPMRLTTGGYVLVNRGWIAGPRLRSDLPEISTLTDTASVITFALNREAENTGPAYAENGWPKRIQNVNFVELSESFGETIAPYEFRLEGEEAVGAFRIEWRISTMGPEKHHGYAVQWFLLSVALLVLTCWASWKFWTKPE